VAVSLSLVLPKVTSEELGALVDFVTVFLIWVDDDDPDLSIV
jgi:hypothetical protein